MLLSLRDRLGPDPSAVLVEFATLALMAGGLARSSLRRRLPASMVLKNPRDYQTEVDVEIERLIVDGITRAFPDFAIKGEEGVGDRSAAADAPLVHIDPIDGTTNFAWGIPHFAIVIALEVKGEITAGVVYDCMMDELFTAEMGRGAYADGIRLACSQDADVANALIGAGLPVPGQVKSVATETYHRSVRRLMDQAAGVRRLGSAALSIAYVACQRLDGFFEDGLSEHDYAASVLILREAGGIVTGFDGGPVSGQSAILAAGPGLHPWLIQGFRD
ncbi:inositol monophosphatase family protein [Consotaella aegiceratis]|uniref:inositol monophosphatase family protein n=1 Tax=Consotaella aegiceratis TaxID=3097961 RepID=UPI002F3E2391